MSQYAAPPGALASNVAASGSKTFIAISPARNVLSNTVAAPQVPSEATHQVIPASTASIRRSIIVRRGRGAKEQRGRGAKVQRGRGDVCRGVSLCPFVPLQRCPLFNNTHQFVGGSHSSD